MAAWVKLSDLATASRVLSCSGSNMRFLPAACYLSRTIIDVIAPIKLANEYCHGHDRKVIDASTRWECTCPPGNATRARCTHLLPRPDRACSPRSAPETSEFS